MSPRRILFVCVGNAYRSQIAEGFFRACAGREWEVHSAGLTPISRLPRETVEVMAERGIDISAQFPKSLEEVLCARFDVIVNMSGAHLPFVGGGVLDWDVNDPQARDIAVLRGVRDEIERRVQHLIVSLRSVISPPTPPATPQGIRRRPERKWDPEGWRRGR